MKFFLNLLEMVYNNDGMLKPFIVSAADIPDLVPILAVLGSFCGGESRIIDAARLRLKESDRLAAMEETLNALGGDVTATADSLIIKGKESLAGGAEVSASVGAGESPGSGPSAAGSKTGKDGSSVGKGASSDASAVGSGSSV